MNTHDGGRLFGTDGVRIWTEPTLELEDNVTVTESPAEEWATPEDEIRYAEEREAIRARLEARAGARGPAEIPDRSGEVDELVARWESLR
jgi:hypothetical protein